MTSIVALTTDGKVVSFIFSMNCEQEENLGSWCDDRNNYFEVDSIQHKDINFLMILAKAIMVYGKKLEDGSCYNENANFISVESLK